MISIPTYNQATNVSPVYGPREQAETVANPMAGLGGVAEGVQTIGDAVKLQDENDAKVYAGRVVSDAHLTWQTELQKRQETAEPGAQNFTPTVMKDYDSWMDQAVQQAPTKASKLYTAQHLNAYRSQLANQAISFEAGAKLAWRGDEYGKTVDNWALVVAQDPSKYDLANSALDQTVPAVDPVHREKLLEYRRQTLGNAWANGMIQANPDAAYNLILHSTLPPESKPERTTGSAPGAYASPPTSSTDVTITPLSGARGIRNNNPGNIVKSDIQWQGEVAGSDPRFSTFSTPEDGIRALGKNLIAYQDHGLNTVQGIISRWAPATDNNDTNAYIATVSKELGVKPDQAIDVKDPAMLRNLATAIIRHENGQQPYSDAQIGAGVNAALGVKELEPNREPTRYAHVDLTAGQTATDAMPDNGMPSVKTGVAALDAMNVRERLHYLQQADQEARKRQQVARADLELKERDQNSQALAGTPPKNPLQEADYIRAYGQADGLRRYGEYTDNQQFGMNVQQLATMAPADQAALIARNKPMPNTPGFANDEKRYELLAKAADYTNNQRVADPIGFAQSKGLWNVKPLNFQDTNAMGAEIANRVSVGRMMNDKFQAPLQLFSKDEASMFSQVMQDAPTSAKLDYLKTIKRSANDPVAYRAAIQQITPDSPVTAVAGVLLDKQDPVIVPHWFKKDDVMNQGDVAGTLLEGESLLNKTKSQKGEDGKSKGLPMPPDKDVRTAFNDVVGKAFAGDANGADVAYQAVRAYYAGSAAREGDVSGVLDSKRLDQAIHAVTGGVTDYNGKGQVLLPWGMSESTFRDEVPKAFAKSIEAAGLKGTQADNVGLYGLQSSGDGRYLVRTGTGYLVGKGGRPIELNLNSQPFMVGNKRAVEAIPR